MQLLVSHTKCKKIWNYICIPHYFDLIFVREPNCQCWKIMSNSKQLSNSETQLENMTFWRSSRWDDETDLGNIKSNIKGTFQTTTSVSKWGLLSESSEIVSRIFKRILIEHLLFVWEWIFRSSKHWTEGNTQFDTVPMNLKIFLNIGQMGDSKRKNYEPISDRFWNYSKLYV